jgi:hypothetical protein
LVSIAILSMSGCVPIRYKVEKPIEEYDVTEIRSLNADELEEHLGQPGVSYLIGGNTYLIYSFPPGSAIFTLTHPLGYLYLGGMIVFLEATIGGPEVDESDPEEVTSLGKKKEWASACLMLTLEANTIIRAEARPWSQKQTCEELFREQLVMAAAKAQQKGDKSAALLHAIWTDDTKVIRTFAEGGNVQAAIELADRTGDKGPLKKLASGKQGDPALQMRLYSNLSRTEPTQSLYWLCQAADNGYFKAQVEVGNLYWRGRLGAKIDLRKAYVWYSLADKSGSDNWDVWELRSVKNEMTPDELTEAEQMLADWRPGQCERNLLFRESH